MEQVVTKYLKGLRVPVSKKYCERLIRSHPDYPSLLSISDTLTRFGIDHKAARVSKEQLAGLNRFQEKYPLQQMNGQNPELETLAAQHSGWFEKVEIKGTPTFFINGYQLPVQYRVEDLSHLAIVFNEHVLAPGEKMRVAEAQQKH